MAEFTLLPPATRFIFQGGEVARRTVGDAFRLPLSEIACRARAAAGRAALWLGPDEHLLIAPQDDRQTIAAELESALAGIAHSLVDVSQRQLAWQIRGADASAILNSGCPLDLDAAEFPPGMCTRTLLGKAEIVLWRKAAEEYHLEVWRSFSDYLLEWLRETGDSESSS
ncbi:MAG: sarcosine oxidase subunit gamma family protein [Steroidobacteraceae bacterium]